MDKPIYRDRATRMSDELMSGLKLLGWDFYMTGPNEWQWVRFDSVKAVAVQCDPSWQHDIDIVNELLRRKVTLERS